MTEQQGSEYGHQHPTRQDPSQYEPPPGTGYRQYPQASSSLTPPRRKRTWLIVAAGGLGTVILLGGLAFAAANLDIDSGDSPAPDEQVDQPAPVVDEPADEPEPEPVYFQPEPEDIDLSIKILSQECFGSAGCLVEFRIEVAFTTTGVALDPTVTYEVTYEVTGGDDPYINTLTMRGDSYTTIDSETIGTPSSDSELVATVTSLSER